MTPTLDFYFDVGSPAAYLAYTQLPKLSADTGAEVRFMPMLLGGVFQATGNSPPIAVPLKGRYLFEDLSRFARRYGVPFQLNPYFPVNTVTLMRAALGLQMRADARFGAYLDAVFRALWVDGRNLVDPATLAEVLTAAGFDAAELLALCAEPQVKEGLKLATQAAVARGIFGAPTFFVGAQMFWGQDRLDFVREALVA